MKTLLVVLTITLIVSSNALNEQERAKILNEHNKLRQQLLQGGVKGQPKASQMPSLIYDPDLEKTAQVLANSCVFKHDAAANRMPPSKDPKYGGYVGQNIYKSWSTKPEEIDPFEAVDSWWKEHKDYNFYANKCAPGKQCGHYTQIAWSKTRYLGCAKMNCPIDSTRMASVMVVCNYAQAGNFVGQRPYVAA